MLARVRTALHGAGYTAAAASRAFGRDLAYEARRRDRTVHLRRLERVEPALATALAFFLLEQPVPADDIERLLPPLRAGDLVELGLAEEDAGMLRATVRILPHDPFLIACDLRSRRGAADLVTGVTRPTTLSSALTVRQPVRRALDLGTGNGILALLCATHAERVVGTDVNEHALELAELNASLNDVANVEFRLGSFLDPVAGERFGLVVTNPPYVVSPATDYLFRDAGLSGDELSEQIVRMLPDVLEEGGFATTTISWIARDDDLAARPLHWLDGAGCDAWLLHTTTDDALTTAAMWNSDLEDVTEYEAQVDRWVDWYRAHDIESLAYGVLVLRKRAGANWTRSTRLPAGGVQSASEHLLRLFSAQDLLAGGVGDRTLVPAADVVVEHSLRLVDGTWSTAQTQLRLDGGLGFTAGLDKPSAAVVAALDGRPFADVLAGIPEEHARAATDLVGRLLELGFVVPA